MRDSSAFISKDFIYAVVGASHNPEKYGYKVFKDLLEAGFTVYPVNPKGGEILKRSVYSKIKNIPEKVDVVVMLVPSEIGMQVIKELNKLGVDKVWFQPGSESEELLQVCKEMGLQYQAHACVMKQRLIV